MGKHLILAGGGHAHMMLLANIRKIVNLGHEVTVVQPSAHHYYSGMGPGMLSTHYSSDDIRFQTRFVVERQGGTFLQAKVVRIEPEDNTIFMDNGHALTYDVLSCNVGSGVPFTNIEGKHDNLFSAKPIEKLFEAQQKIIDICKRDRISIGIIGGGPAAIEIAGNSCHLAKLQGCKSIDVRIFAGKKLMNDFNSSIQRIIRNTFTRESITVDESGYITAIKEGTIYCENKNTFTPDIIFLATGVRPSPLFEASPMATGPDGGLPVNEYLQSTQFSNIFGGGDCIYHTPRPLAKVGVYAVRENPVLLNNVLAVLNNDQLQKFDPGGNYLLIFNLGNGIGALQKGVITFGGKLAFTIKDYIDRKFIRTFQALEK